MSEGKVTTDLYVYERRSAPCSLYTYLGTIGMMVLQAQGVSHLTCGLDTVFVTVNRYIYKWKLINKEM